MDEQQARTLVAELYRGILRREPDESGLAGHAAALVDDSSPQRLAQMVEDFRRSGEAEIIDAKLRGILGADRPSPIGPINHVISLGTDCYASFLFKLAGWKRASYPFDWILSSPPMVADILRDDFAQFLDPINHRTIPMEQRRGPNERCADHLLYRERFGIDAIFMHRDITAPAHQAYYRRTVERFRAVMSSDDAKLLLMTNTAAKHATPDDFEALCGIIDQRYRNAMLLCVNVERVENGNIAQIGGSVERQMGPHELVRYRASSKLNGTTFTNWIDDINLRGMIGQYQMALTSA